MSQVKVGYSKNNMKAHVHTLFTFSTCPKVLLKLNQIKLIISLKSWAKGDKSIFGKLAQRLHMSSQCTKPQGTSNRQGDSQP